MCLRVLQEHFESAGTREAWTSLSETSSQASLFNTYEWCRCWAETLGSNTRPAILRFIDENGATVGLAPFCTRGGGAGRWLQFMGRERASGDHLDVLWSPTAPDDSGDALVAHLDRFVDAFGGLLLGEMEPGSGTRASIIRWAESHSYPWRERERRRLPYIQLPADFDTFLSGLSQNMRYHVRRRRRGLERIDGACIRMVRSRDESESALNRFFDLHRLRWQRDGLPGNFADPPMQTFLRQFCAVAADRGWLRILLLEVRGEALGVLIAFHFRGTAYYYQMGWHPECSVESPGVLLLASSIESAVAEGMERYDLLRGEEDYKFRWTSQATEATTLIVARNQVVRAALHAEAFKDGLKRTVCRYLGQRSWDRARCLLTGRSA